MASQQLIEFSEEQSQLLEIAVNFCRDKSPISIVREAIEGGADHDAALWTEMAELGWLGVAVPEDFGGSGLSLAEVVTIMEPMGRHLMGTPFLSTTLAAQTLVCAGTEGQKFEHLPKICEGMIATLAVSEPHGDWDLTNLSCKGTKEGDTIKLSGTKTFVTDAASADLIIASIELDGAPALVLIEAAHMNDGALTRETVIDETRASYRLSLDGISVPAANLLSPDKTVRGLAHLHKCANLLLAAQMCGGTSGVLDVTVEYLNTRKQFDRYIGSYQALKHPVVDVLTGLDAARSHLYHAATVFAENDGEMAVRMAKAQASDVFAFAADRSIQFHGGFGFTYECDAQLYRRRSLFDQYQYGDAAYHRKQLANVLF